MRPERFDMRLIQACLPPEIPGLVVIHRDDDDVWREWANLTRPRTPRPVNLPRLTDEVATKEAP